MFSTISLKAFSTHRIAENFLSALIPKVRRLNRRRNLPTDRRIPLIIPKKSVGFFYQWVSFFVGSILFFLSGCEKRPEPANSQEASYFRQIEQFRTTKDDHFAASKKSPLLKGDKESFQGLKYFPINPAFRFMLQLHKYNRPDTIEIMTTDGYDRPALRYGYFEFDAKGQRNRLQIYKFLDADRSYKSSLFLPFLDQTAGEKTYGGGRYIDLPENQEGIYELDFNLAYNPSCAYGRKEYRCPIPPSENTLKISVTAGELAWLK